MLLTSFIKTVLADPDWTVSVHVSKGSFGEAVCSVWAYHAFGGFLFLSDGYFIDNPSEVVAALEQQQVSYVFTDNTDHALLIELGVISGDVVPVQSVEQPAKYFRCKICGKSSFKTPLNCKNPATAFSGAWQCQLNREFVGSGQVSRKEMIICLKGAS